MTARPDIELSYANGLNEGIFEDVVEDLKAGEVRVDLRGRASVGPYASLVWLIPTAVMLWMVKPYLQEFSRETGKVHAKGLHEGLSKLWRKVFGPKPEISYTLVGSSGKVKSEIFSAAVSLRASRNDGGTVILLFPSTASPEDFSAAVDRWIHLMQMHYGLEGNDPLTKTMRSVS